MKFQPGLMGGKQRNRAAKKIALLGWYGSGNAGDEAVLQAVVSSLRQHGHRDLLVLSTDPQRTAARYRVNSVRRSPLSLETLHGVWNAKALVLGGGGLIQDSSSVYNLPLYTSYVAIARMRGLPIVGWGLGAGPLYTKLGRLLARFIVNSSSYFSVRDPQAKGTLLHAGVSAERVVVSADPAFLIQPSTHVQRRQSRAKQVALFCIRHRLHDQPGLNLRYLLPVSVRHRLRLETRPGAQEDERFLDSVAQAVQLCVTEFGMQAVLLPFWAERDDEVLREVERRALALGVSKAAISWAAVEHTPSALAAYIAEADLLVSMRLHALIFGASAGVPLLALSYVPKMRSLMRRLGAERWVVEVQTRVPTPEEIGMKLRGLAAHRQGEAEKLRRNAQAMKMQARQDAARIGTILYT